MKTVEIYFGDLREECQKELLEAYGISDPEEANWRFFPIATIEIDPDEVKNDEET